MTAATRDRAPGGGLFPQEHLAALRQAGPLGVAEAFGDLAHLLKELAGVPGTAFELDGTARGDLTTLLGNLRETGTALEALEARAVIALRDATRRDRRAAARDRAAHERAAEPSRSRIDADADSATTEDISLTTRRSPHAAGRTLASAGRLVELLPQMMTALRTGRISGDAAYAVAGAVSVLDPDLARAVDRELGERLPELDGAGTRRWKDAVAAIANELDPEGTTLRHRRAMRERHVTLTPGQNGMATLSARLSAIDARRIAKALSLEAERRRAAGARGGHGAAMADAFRDIFLGDCTAAGITADGADGSACADGADGSACADGADGTARTDGRARTDVTDRGARVITPPPTLEIGVIITDRALLHPDSGDAAHLEGYGPVPVEAVREQLRAALATPEDPAQDPYGAGGDRIRVTLRRLYTHPTTGELVAMDSSAREFPPAMKRFLSLRDTTCRGPYCNAAVRQSDHIQPVSRGGPTSLDNGEGLCAHCNQKEVSAAHVARVEDSDRPGHRVQWTGHSGITRITTPTALVRPRRPSPESGEQQTQTPPPAPLQSFSRRRRRRGAAPPHSRRRGPLTPGHSERTATDADATDQGRRGRPSSRRRPPAAPADDPDH